MKFEIKHAFRQDPRTVAEAMLSDAVGPHYTERMTTIIEVEGLSRDEDGERLRVRNRYLPVPLIRRVGPKRVDPKWMEWIAELDFDRGTSEGTYRNLPTTGRVAKLPHNQGTLSLEGAPGGGTTRILRGELKVKVMLLGRVAEKIIYKNAVKILDEEAKILQELLDEGLV